MAIYEFSIPITNLFLSKKSYKLGLVKFRKVSPSCQNIILNRSKNLPLDDDYINEKIPLDSTICEVNSASKSFDEAFKDAFSEIDTAINVLKLFREPLDDYLRKYFGQVGDLIEANQRMIIFERLTGTYSFGISKETVGFRNRFILDANRINNMKKNGIKLICSILESKRNKLDESIISSINWYGKSFNSYSSEKKIKSSYGFIEPERFLYCFTALESLIIQKKEPISPNLPRRIAHLCELVYKNKKLTSKKVKELYKKRGEIIHDGLKFISKQDFHLLSKITQKTILSLIKRRKKLKINTKEDLMNWFIEKDLA